MITLQNGQALSCIDLGIIEYQAALSLQEELHALRKNEEIGDTVLFLEHPHVYTLGRRGVDADILLNPEKLDEMEIAVFRSNRGGQVTYHGPGQLVVYFIVNLYSAQRELRLFVETLEASVISYLAQEQGISAHIEPDYPGVWVGNQKIAALGISVKDKVTMHGFALNISTNLALFSHIIPCGIRDRGVTSISALSNRAIDLSQTKQKLAEILALNCGCPGIRWTSLPLLGARQS